jgi:hypothetical protein
MMRGCQMWMPSVQGVKRASKKEGNFCEHGIWKCAICDPQPRTGKVNHHKASEAVDVM